jgi:drug/metabolite transporter (DMT)-like permease
MKNNQSKGILYAFVASVALAGSFVFSKSALNQLTLVHFGLLWFSLGILWNAAWFLIRKEYRGLSRMFVSRSLVALLIASLEGGATVLFYLSIREMDNPAVVSFIGNIGPVFVTIFGLTLLREKFLRSQMAGIVITLLGVSLINYRDGSFAGFLDPGALYVIVASFLFAWATIAGRKFREWLNPGYMSLIRAVLLTLVMGWLFVRGGNGHLFQLDLRIWRDLILGSFLETMIVIVFAYKALILIEATRTSLIISTKGVWALVLAWLFLGVFPQPAQLAGGLVTLAGVWLITNDRPIFRRE